MSLRLLASLWLVLGATFSAAQGEPVAGPKPFLLGGIQTHEVDHQRWAAALHQAKMNTVQVTVYAYQGPWNTAKLWYHEEEPAVLHEIRTARQNGLQVVLVLRVALDHNDPENRFLWHGLTYPETREATEKWFQIYTDFVVKWAKIAEREGVEVLGIASEMNSLAATLPVEEIPPLAEYYLDDKAQQRLRNLVGRSEHLFTEEARRNMGAGDFEVLDDFLVERNRAERGWARAYTFDGSEDRIAAINAHRALLDARWREMVKQTRGVYSGRLTLAANFDNYHEVSFWDALDFIGINAYFPLREALETPLSEDGLLISWREIFAKIDAFRQTHNLAQPVIFTELGYTRYEGVTVAPWSSQGFIPFWDPNEQTDNDRAFFWSSQPFDPSERALAMGALHRLWSEGDSGLAGILYWKLSSRLDLQRFEPFMLFIGESSKDPMYEALTRFSDGIRPLGPMAPGDDPYLQSVKAIVRDDLAALKAVGEAGWSAKPAGQAPLLHLAVRLGRGAHVRHLVSSGADLNGADEAGFLPIHWACYQHGSDLVTLLLPSSQAPWLDGSGETPLMKCARLDNASVARELIKAGVEVQAQNRQGRSALHLAVDQASRQMVEVLTGSGADVDAPDQEGISPLHVAARRGDVELVRILAKESKGRPDQKGNYPAHEAAFYGKPHVFQLVFEPSMAKKANGERQTLLHLASYGGDLEILETLLPHFPSVDLADENGWTPLFYAIADGRAEAVEALLKRGASVTFRSDDNSTPLHKAGACWESRVIQRILENKAGIDLDMVDGEGNTALHHAAGWGWVDNVRLLLAAGASPGIRNKKGETALDVAVESRRRRAAELLRQAARSAKRGPARGESAEQGSH